MAYSTFERWNGSSWVNESSLIRLSINDELYQASSASVTIADPNNTAAANYSPFQKIRIKEGSTKITVFYGKILNILPENDNQYGQIVIIEARDNLHELSQRNIEADYSSSEHAGWLRKDTLIKDIINGHSSSSKPAHAFSGNITTTDTNKLTASAVTGTVATKWNFKSEGSGKSVLEAIKEISSSDSHSAANESFGYAFWLDYKTSGNAVISDLNYVKRGTYPTGASATYGLTVEFGGTEADQRKSMYGNYTFESNNVQELITRVDVSYVDSNKKPKSISFILINTGAHTGTFTEDEAITWSGSHAATIRKIGGSGSTRFALISDFSVAGLAALPGTAITGTSSSATATVNSSTAALPGVLSIAIEQEIVENLELSDFESTHEVYQATFALLFQTNDSVERGEIIVSRFPYITITGTHTGSNNSSVLIDSSKNFTNYSIQSGSMVENVTEVTSSEVSSVANATSLNLAANLDWDTNESYKLYKLIRPGTTIHVKNSRLSIDKEMIVTGIDYDEGGGIIESLIRVMSVTRGVAARRTLNTARTKKLADASGSNKSRSGATPLSQQQYQSNVKFTEVDSDTVAWSSGSIVFGDGTSYSTTASNTGNMSSDTPYFIYFDADSSTTALYSTSTEANTKGPNKILLCTALAGATSGDAPQIRPQQGDTSSPIGKTFVQASAPTGTTNSPLKRGDIWFDSDDGNKIYRWGGSSWGSTLLETGAGKNKITRDANPPSNPGEGDLFLDTDNDRLYQADANGVWQPRDDAEAINAASTNIDGGLINTQKIVIGEGGGNVLRTSATYTAATDENRIEIAHTGMKGITRSGTVDTTQFELEVEDGSGHFGGGHRTDGALSSVLDEDGITLESDIEEGTAGDIRLTHDGSLRFKTYTWPQFVFFHSTKPLYLAAGGNTGTPNDPHISPASHNFIHLGFHDVDGSGAIRSWQSLSLAAGNSGYVQIKGASSGTWSLTLPADNGADGEVLKTDGNGVTDWIAVGGSGDITAVIAGTGLTGGATGGDATLNVIGGTGITANSNDIAIDSTVATLTGSQTLTNKSIDLGTNTLSGSVAEFNTALQSANFATLAGTETLTNKTLTTPTISSTGFTNAQHSHAGATTGGSISAVGQKVDYGVYSGSGGNTNGVSTDITTVKAVFIWEKPSSWDDLTGGNRDTLNMKFYIATETFGDYGGEGHMAIHHPYGDDFYGGRINFSGSSFYVYHSGTYWTGSSNSVNVSGTDYYWLAIGD